MTGTARNDIGPLHQYIIRKQQNILLHELNISKRQLIIPSRQNNKQELTITQVDQISTHPTLR